MLSHRLYLMMRSTRTMNWVSLLDNAVEQLNSRPMQKLKGLSPNSFNSVFDDVKLQRPNEACEGQLNLENPTVSTMEGNQKDYKMSGNKFQLNSYVYCTRKKSNAFSKSFDLKVKHWTHSKFPFRLFQYFLGKFNAK